MVGKRRSSSVLIDDMVEAQTKKAMIDLKKRKTRRGKKRKDKDRRVGDNVICSDEMNVNFSDNSTMDFQNCDKCGIDNEINKDYNKSRGRNSRQTLRPHCSPSAPHNSTQFLMDDHKTLSGLYSHDQEITQSPKYISPVFQNSPFYDHSFSEDYGLDSLFRDPDVEGFSSTLSFMEHNFEATYRDMRLEELSKLSKTELCNSILEMENKSNHFEKALEMSVSEQDSAMNDFNKTMHMDISSTCSSNNDVHIKKGRHLRKLIKENERLRIENESLRQLLSSS